MILLLAVIVEIISENGYIRLRKQTLTQNEVIFIA